ncbi:MAG: tRNA lysidine(34) synthetase TilS [Verrucomicrobiota bacterium]|nr:tRNA lysidine(34) synthetase TilS [Verrucomicrobiota bacterium]
METSIPQRFELMERATRFAGLVSRSVLHPRVATVLEQLPDGGMVGVGCSGGADSVGALCLVWAHFPELRERIRVLHFNHGLRGGESEHDAEFVMEMSEGLGLAFVGGRWERHAGEAAPSEAEARAERLAFFMNAARKEHCSVIILGHHADDVLETQLMRLARGQGSHGLSSPRPIQAFGEVKLLRPLLNITKSTLVTSLESAGIAWREDGSNSTADYTRNRLRRDVIPLLREIIPQDPVLGAARAREMLEMEDAALSAQLDNLLPAEAIELSAGAQLDLSPLIHAPDAIIHRALHRWLEVNALHENLSREASECVQDGIVQVLRWKDTMAEPMRWSAGPYFIVLKDNMLSLALNTPKPAEVIPPISLNLPCDAEALAWPYGGTLCCERVTLTPQLYESIIGGGTQATREAWVDYDKLGLSPEGGCPLRLLVRNWLPGDAFQPLGAPGRRKLQDLFTDKKIPPRERRCLPIVLEGNNKIIWVPGFAPAQLFSLGKASVTALRLTYNQA